MDKYDFLQLCSKYGGLTEKLYEDYGENINGIYGKLTESGEIALFHGFICLVSGRINSRTYALVPYTGTYSELQDDPAFTEYHSWRAAAEKKICENCGRIYFAADEADNCPYC